MEEMAATGAMAATAEPVERARAAAWLFLAGR
jgi:hypothetical protein